MHTVYIIQGTQVSCQNCSICCYLEYCTNINKLISDIYILLTVGRVVASYCNLYALQVFSVWAIATMSMNVRYFNHAFVIIDIAPLIVTNAVLSTLCKSLPMSRNAECFHEYFRDVVSCQVTFWSNDVTQRHSRVTVFGAPC